MNVEGDGVVVWRGANTGWKHGLCYVCVDKCWNMNQAEDNLEQSRISPKSRSLTLSHTHKHTYTHTVNPRAVHDQRRDSLSVFVQNTLSHREREPKNVMFSMFWHHVLYAPNTKTVPRRCRLKAVLHIYEPIIILWRHIGDAIW